ncbi:MAG: glutathione S-transferase family protein [Myxococcales bacterium]|nr:glutathione S-transferase family protein [Myxococcales bacterium]
MLTVVHLENSRSDRLIWLLEELGLDYAVDTYERDPETQRAPAEMKALHPYAKAPMLRDGDRVLIESGAIFEYVLAKYGNGRLVPAVGDADWAEYLQWLHFAEGSAMLPLLLDHFQAAGLCGPPGESGLAAMARSELGRLYGYLESVLARREYIAGDRFTAADVMMGWFIEMIDQRGEIGPYDAMKRYVARLRSRPAHQRARIRAFEG